MATNTTKESADSTAPTTAVDVVKRLLEITKSGDAKWQVTAVNGTAFTAAFRHPDPTAEDAPQSGQPILSVTVGVHVQLDLDLTYFLKFSRDRREVIIDLSTPGTGLNEVIKELFSFCYENWVNGIIADFEGLDENLLSPTRRILDILASNQLSKGKR